MNATFLRKLLVAAAVLALGAAPPPPEKGARAGQEQAARRYLAELRAAVKKDDAAARYRLLVDARYKKTLHWAAREGQDIVVVELYRAWTNESGGTPLTLAAGNNDVETLRILVKNRALNPNTCDAQGRTALHRAAAWGPATVELLLARGADVNARTKQGQTPLMVAVGSWAASWDPGAVGLLLKKGAAVNVRDHSGRTALMYAAEQGQLESARLLLAHKADARLTDKKGKTARARAKDPVLAARAPGLLSEKRLQELKRQEQDDGRELRRLLEAAEKKKEQRAPTAPPARCGGD